MKEKLLTILTVVLIGVLLVLLQSCKKDDPEPDDLSVFTNKISQTWKVSRATLDDVDVSGSFKNMSITFREDQVYSVANAVSPIWPSNGSFEIIQSGDNQYDIKRSDGVMINVTSLTDASVVLELLYTSKSGRVSEVSGHYKFELTR